MPCCDRGPTKGIPFHFRHRCIRLTSCPSFLQRERRAYPGRFRGVRRCRLPRRHSRRSRPTRRTRNALPWRINELDSEAPETRCAGYHQATNINACIYAPVMEARALRHLGVRSRTDLHLRCREAKGRHGSPPTPAARYRSIEAADTKKK